MEQSTELLRKTMDQLGYGYSEAALDWLANSDYEGPFHMVNLHKFHEVAEYPDGYEGKRAETGAEANGLYIEAILPLIEHAGNTSVVRNTVIGTAAQTDSDEEWDFVAVVYYPSRASFIELISSPIYREAVVHKHAALKRTRAIITLPGGPIVDPRELPAT